MRVQLVPQWKRVLRKAWSVKLTLLAALLGGIEIALPLFADSAPRHVFLGPSIVVTVGACIARLVAQPSMSDDAR